MYKKPNGGRANDLTRNSTGCFPVVNSNGEDEIKQLKSWKEIKLTC